MSDQPRRGISRQGLDAAFEAEETRKSNLILEGRWLGVQGKLDEAAHKMAQAAEIEEKLTGICREKGLREKAWIHHFSAAGCWAQAGNFYDALRVGDELLADSQLLPGLRERVQAFTQSLRQKRAQWHAESQKAAAND